MSGPTVELILKGLNAEQREVALHGNGPVLVLAVAGSGKTRAIAHRAACLIAAQCVSPHHILCLTFTNKAAGEMRERISHLVGGRLNGITIATFHALCARLLRIHHNLIPRSRRYVIYDGEDTARLVRRVARGMGVEGCWTQLFTDIARLKNGGILPADDFSSVLDRYHPESPYLVLLRQAYLSYERRMARYDALDFTDLLLKATLMLEQHPEVLDHARHRYRHILVDEYQDTCPLQERLLRLLSAPAYNLCAVGDDDQAIYAFRHADVAGILTFGARYPDARVIRMEENYRSTGAIIQTARMVIRANRQRQPKSIRTANPRGIPVEIVGFPSEGEEARWIREKIIELKTRDGSYGRIAILCRVASLFRPIERELANHLIPYCLIEGLAFWERREVKDMMAYLRYIRNPLDYLSFERIANTPRRGIGKKTLKRIEERLKASPDVSVGQILKEARLHSRPLRLFLDQMDSLRNGGRISALIREVMEKTGYEKHLFKMFPDAVRRMSHLAQLGAMAKRFESEQSDDPDEFLLQSGLMQQTEDGPQDAVRLLTIHAAKGLEFQSVFIVGLEDGILPHARCRDNVEEERRLFYVAITRAKMRLYLSCSARRMVQGRETSHVLSPFVREILSQKTLVSFGPDRKKANGQPILCYKPGSREKPAPVS